MLFMVEHKDTDTNCRVHKSPDDMAGLVLAGETGRSVKYYQSLRTVKTDLVHFYSFYR
jgi:hypothetical protein